MKLNVNFMTRDFALPIDTGLVCEPQSLSWSAFGGPQEAVIKVEGALANLIKALNLLRCPVMISDYQTSPVWWGYVSKIKLNFKKTSFKASIDDVYNRVRVRFSYLSPDNRVADQSTTEFSEDLFSQLAYGVREVTLHRSDIDGDFGEQLRDTFLASHSLPKTLMSNYIDDEGGYALLSCAGWFSTLAWQGYDSDNGFYANQGPGPGSFIFGRTSSDLFPSQSFTTTGSSDLKYVQFMLRKFGSPTRNISVVLFADNGGSIGLALSNSNPISASTISSDSFQWATFEFGTPCRLSSGTKYWLTIDQNGVSSSKYFSLRLDENMGYKSNQGLYFNGSTWVAFPTVTNPSGVPDAYFRAVCVCDTGSQIMDIATAGNQFFQQIEGIQTGISTSPYRVNGRACINEIQDLMQMGTARNRLVLAKATSERILQFYEQPDAESPTAYMDQNGEFFTARGKQLNPFSPPVGQWVGFASTDWVLSPWDGHRVPACFIETARLNCLTGKMMINSE